MKILDKYVVKNFLIGYAIAFCVLIGLRIIIDLFVNLDEFTESPELGAPAVIKNILIFYGLNSTLYFRDFAGMITVVAASFSFGKMVRLNELVAVMASGVSLQRVIVPIVLLALLLTGLLVIDQEFIIPPLADQLARRHNDIPGEKSYNVWFIGDGNGSLICSQSFVVKTSTLHKPTILLRRKKTGSEIWELIGRIDADRAVYNSETGRWDLINGRFTEKGSIKGAKPIAFYASDLTSKEIPARIESEHKTFLSWRQLAVLVAQAEQGKIKDLRQLLSQKHFRVTKPLINLAMLMVCLPILVCRDPKSTKSATMISFAMVGVCFIATFICEMLAPEASDFYRIGFWAWMPVLVFLPIAFIKLDSMKT
ncbi:MAG: LptF/LptG family permease [Planctomycetota bacterium]|jgi:lipopolysaccharide export system permease protein